MKVFRIQLLWSSWCPTTSLPSPDWTSVRNHHNCCNHKRGRWWGLAYRTKTPCDCSCCSPHKDVFATRWYRFSDRSQSDSAEGKVAVTSQADLFILDRLAGQWMMVFFPEKPLKGHVKATRLRRVKLGASIFWQLRSKEVSQSRWLTLATPIRRQRVKRRLVSPCCVSL